MIAMISAYNKLFSATMPAIIYGVSSQRCLPDANIENTQLIKNDIAKTECVINQPGNENAVTPSSNIPGTCQYLVENKK
jgi:hypothetical protein